MKNILLVILFISFNSLTAQDLTKIKESNVFFVLFENGNFQKKAIFGIARDKEPPYNYLFYNSKSSGKEFDFYFSYNKYSSFDDAHNDMNSAMLVRIDKSFLKKNKDIIITQKFMEEIGERAMIKLFSIRTKYIFIIDTEEEKKGDILLRQVRFVHMPVHPEPEYIELEEH